MQWTSRTVRIAGGLVLAAFACALAETASAQRRPTVISGAGDVAPLVEEFRKLLGEPNNGGIRGSQFEGRRELDWDSVPDDKAAPALLPPDFFRNRGAILRTSGRGVQVSAGAASAKRTPPRFGHINPAYQDLFKVFSGERLFSAIGSPVVNLTFVVPGTNRAAVVRGFGAVFVDAPAGQTAIQAFDRYGKLLGKFGVPAAADGGFSFLGLVFDQVVVARVRIDCGAVALSAAGRNEVSVLDDVIYAEPQPMTVSSKRD